MPDQPSRPTSIETYFADLHDPRVEGRCSYKLIDILIIAICAAVCGADDWVAVETFGKSIKSWLMQFVDLPEDAPSHDTFGDVFAVLDAETFEQCFARWVAQVFQVTEGQIVAIDGKTVRRSHDRTIGKDAIHMVNAWAQHNGIALGQVKTDQKSNEITAIPKLLELLTVSGCIVTIDAMGCQKKIAKAIRDKGADYFLSVKGNQERLHQMLKTWFDHGENIQFRGMDCTHKRTVNKGHGRIEIRDCWAINDPLAFKSLQENEGWVDVGSIVRIVRERRIGDKIQTDIAYHISSLPNDAELCLSCSRSHWAVENSLHWVLDVIFKEDESRIRTGNAPQNFAILRQIALNILKNDKSKGSLKKKRFKAALNDRFLFKLLAQI
jgi:predicted transposase YbfD/YdcC